MKHTTTIRLTYRQLKAMDSYLKFKKNKWPTRSSFISSVLDEAINRLESNLSTNLKGHDLERFKEERKTVKKAAYMQAIQDKKDEIRKSLKKYRSRNKIQKLIDTEREEIANWLYAEYSDYYLDEDNPLSPPYDSKYDL